jgi:hypothetical protein
MPSPEELARQHIDEALIVAGWAVLDIADTNLDASRGVGIQRGRESIPRARLTLVPGWQGG